MIKHTGLHLYKIAALRPHRKGEIAEGMNTPKRKGPYSDRVYPSGPEVGFIFQGGVQ